MLKKAILPKAPPQNPAKAYAVSSQLVACSIGLASILLIGFFMSLWQELLYGHRFVITFESVLLATGGGVIYGFVMYASVRLSKR